MWERFGFHRMQGVLLLYLCYFVDTQVPYFGILGGIANRPRRHPRRDDPVAG